MSLDNDFELQPTAAPAANPDRPIVVVHQPSRMGLRIFGPRKDAAELAGRTGNNRVVNFAGGAELAGRFVDVRITAALPHSLRGELA